MGAVSQPCTGRDRLAALAICSVVLRVRMVKTQASRARRFLGEKLTLLIDNAWKLEIGV